MIVAARPRFEWALRTRLLPLGERTLLAGILNITPDSFSDSGRFFSWDKAVERALHLLDEGADILDIGAESTRPGQRPPVSSQEELDRLLPVLETVLHERPTAIVSVDTYKAETARAAIVAGADIVNDVSGFQWDPAMAKTCAELAPGVILMHTRGRMQEWLLQPPLAIGEVLPLVQKGLRERAEIARAAGLGRGHIVLDPGFGFGKSGDENYPLLARFDELHALGYPLLAGASRKSFLGKTLEPLYGRKVLPAERDDATLVTVAAAALAGAHVLRVHEIGRARDAIAIADAIRAAAR